MLWVFDGLKITEGLSKGVLMSWALSLQSGERNDVMEVMELDQAVSGAATNSPK